MSASDVWIDFVAGWCSGATAVIACQPIDTILTRYQAGLAAQQIGQSAYGSVASAGYRRTITTALSSSTSATVGSWVVRDMAQSLAKADGWKALWRGSSPMIGSVPIQNAMLMGGYGLGRRYSEEYVPNYRLTAIFVGGCTGGILQSFLMSPVELVKVSQQCAGKSLKVAGREVLLNMHQVMAWRGLGATLLRDGIPHGVWFVAYEATKQRLHQMGEEAHGSILFHNRALIPLTSGAVAATVAWAVGYPADLIKTRIQTSQANLGIVETARLLIKEANGHVVTGLYKGFGLKLLRAVPASMIGFTTYELVASCLVF